MIGQFVDTMMLASVNKYTVVIMTHHTLSLEKHWKLFSATLGNILILSELLHNSYLFTRK